MKFKHPRFISISISSTLVKAAQVTSSGVVELVAKQAIEKGAANSALQEILTKFKTKGAGIICSVAGDISTTKTLDVPSAHPDEIESILALQATRFTPLSKDEILTGYVKLGSPKPNFSRVLLIVVNRETVKEKLDVFKVVGLHADTVIFSPEAIANLYAQALKIKKTDAPLALIDVGSQNTNFIVLSQGGVIMTRSIPVGFQQLSSDPESGKQLVEEIKVSVHTYEQEGVSPKIGKVCFTTSHAALAGLDALIAEAVGVKVEVVPFAKYVKASRETTAALSADFADESALDIIAAGAMIAKCQAELIPQEIKDQRTLVERGRETMKAGGLVLLSLFLIAGAMLSKVYFKEQFLKQNLIAKYSKQSAEVEGLERTIAKTRLLNDYLSARELPLEVIRELYHLIPQEIYLNAINLDNADNVSIQGISQSMSKVFALVTALEDSPFFEGVKTKSTASKKVGGKDVATFEITMKLVTRAAAPAASPVKEKAVETTVPEKK
jgi:Tfp pilus assembly PilM family ATPase/Tfp pilus assembly protein PilN